MTLYLFTLNPEGFKELDLPEGQSYADFNCLRWNGDSKLANWKTPELVWFTNEFSQGNERDGDFLKFRSGAPVVTEKIKNLLPPLVQNCIEFLPVKIAMKLVISSMLFMFWILWIRVNPNLKSTVMEQLGPASTLI